MLLTQRKLSHRQKADKGALWGVRAEGPRTEKGISLGIRGAAGSAHICKYLSIIGRVFQAVRGRILSESGAGGRGQGAVNRPEQRWPDLGELYCAPVLARC